VSDQGDVPRRALHLTAGLDQAQVVHAHRQALLVLRPSIDDADFDAISDRPWPLDVVPFVDRALIMSRNELEAAGPRARKKDFRLGIGADVRDDAQFEVLLALAPFTISASGFAGGRFVFDANDTGTSMWIAVTEEQETELRSRLEALGISPDIFTEPAPRAPRTRRFRWRRGRV